MSHVKIKGIDCYGVMDEYQNIEVKCEDETDDFISDGGFVNWTAAVQSITDYIEQNNLSAPVELETC